MSVCVSKDEADTGLSVLIVPLTTQQLPHIVALAVGLKCMTHTLKSAVIIKNLSVPVSLPSIVSVLNLFLHSLFLDPSKRMHTTFGEDIFTFSISMSFCLVSAFHVSLVIFSVIELSMNGCCGCKAVTHLVHPPPPVRSSSFIYFYIISSTITHLPLPLCMFVWT